MQKTVLYVRALLFYVGVFALTIPFSLLALLLIPLPAVTRSRWVSGWAHAVMWWLKVTCNLRYEVTGRAHIPANPSIILAKHQSAWETIALQTIFPPQVWVLKRELLMMILQIVVLSMLLGIGLLKESTNLKPKKVSFPAMR